MKCIESDVKCLVSDVKCLIQHTSRYGENFYVCLSEDGKAAYFESIKPAEEEAIEGRNADLILIVICFQ